MNMNQAAFISSQKKEPKKHIQIIFVQHILLKIRAYLFYDVRIINGKN